MKHQFDRPAIQTIGCYVYKKLWREYSEQSQKEWEIIFYQSKKVFYTTV